MENLWYSPWWTHVSPMDVLFYVWLGLTVAWFVLYMVEERRYKRVWRRIGRSLIALIVCCETLWAMSKELPERVKVNLQHERIG